MLLRELCKIAQEVVGRGLNVGLSDPSLEWTLVSRGDQVRLLIYSRQGRMETERGWALPRIIQQPGEGGIPCVALLQTQVPGVPQGCI